VAARPRVDVGGTDLRQSYTLVIKWSKTFICSSRSIHLYRWLISLLIIPWPLHTEGNGGSWCPKPQQSDVEGVFALVMDHLSI
jgi:hypothetical protein